MISKNNHYLASKQQLKNLSKLLAVALVLLSCLFLVGWMIPVPLLIGENPHTPLMVPNTALGLMLAGITILLLHSPKTALQTFALLPAAILALLGGLTLFEYSYIHPLPWLPIDNLLTPLLALTPVIIRPSLIATISLFVAGVVLSYIAYQPHYKKIPNEIFTGAILIFLLALWALLAAYYQLSLAQVFGYQGATAISLPGIACLLLLSISLLLIAPQNNLITLLNSRTAGGHIARILIPIAFCIPIIIDFSGSLISHNIAPSNLMPTVKLDYSTTLISQFILILILMSFIYRLSQYLNQLERQYSTLQLSKKQQQLALSQLQELKVLSVTDALTNLYNRRQFNSLLSERVELINKQKIGFSLILLDIDYFKRYNDHYGHQAGDEALQQVASVLLTQVPENAGQVFRIGGEEFAIITRDVMKDNVQLLLDRIYHHLHDLAIPHSQSAINDVITLSIGAAIVCHAPTSCKAIYEGADRALYHSKQNGRNQTTLMTLYVDPPRILLNA